MVIGISVIVGDLLLMGEQLIGRRAVSDAQLAEFISSSASASSVGREVR